MKQTPPATNPRQRLMLIAGAIGLCVAAVLVAWQLWPEPLATPALSETGTNEPAEQAAATQPIQQQTRAGAAAAEPERTNYRVAPR